MPDSELVAAFGYLAQRVESAARTMDAERGAHQAEQERTAKAMDRLTDAVGELAAEVAEIKGRVAPTQPPGPSVVTQTTHAALGGLSKLHPAVAVALIAVLPVIAAAAIAAYILASGVPHG